MVAPVYLRIPLALDILLNVLREIFPPLRDVLPVGGDQVIQLSVLVCLGLACHELGQSFGWRADDDDDHNEPTATA